MTTATGRLEDFVTTTTACLFALLLSISIQSQTTRGLSTCYTCAKEIDDRCKVRREQCAVENAENLCYITWTNSNSTTASDPLKSARHNRFERGCISRQLLTETNPDILKPGRRPLQRRCSIFTTPSAKSILCVCVTKDLCNKRLPIHIIETLPGFDLDRETRIALLSEKNASSAATDESSTTPLLFRKTNIAVAQQEELSKNEKNTAASDADHEDAPHLIITSASRPYHASLQTATTPLPQQATEESPIKLIHMPEQHPHPPTDSSASNRQQDPSSTAKSVVTQGKDPRAAAEIDEEDDNSEDLIDDEYSNARESESLTSAGSDHSHKLTQMNAESSTVSKELDAKAHETSDSNAYSTSATTSVVQRTTKRTKTSASPRQNKLNHILILTLISVIGFNTNTG